MSDETVEIVDCVAREKLVVERYGGDVVLRFFDYMGRQVYVFVVEMRRNDPRVYRRLVEALRLFRGNLVQRWSVFDRYAREYRRMVGEGGS